MSREEPAVRLAAPPDLPAIARLEAEIFGPDAYPAAELLRLAEHPDTFVHAVARDAEVVGYSICQLRAFGEFLDDYRIDARAVPVAPPRHEIIGYLKTIAVKEDARFRRRGLATALHQTRIALLRERGVHHAFALQMPSAGLAAFHARLGLSRLPAAVDYRYANGGRPSLWYAPL